MNSEQTQLIREEQKIGENNSGYSIDSASDLKRGTVGFTQKLAVDNLKEVDEESISDY